MEQLERFLLIASGDDLAGTLSNPGAQVRVHMQLYSLQTKPSFMSKMRTIASARAQQCHSQCVVAELLAIGGSVTLRWMGRLGPAHSAWVELGSGGAVAGTVDVGAHGVPGHCAADHAARVHRGGRRLHHRACQVHLALCRAGAARVRLWAL